MRSHPILPFLPAGASTPSAPGDPEVERVRAVLEARFGLGGVEPAARIGEYVMLDRIGAGRTGVVHRAYHRALDHTVAIKIVHAEVDSRGLRERLRARERAVVNGSCIVPVLEVGVDLRTYVVMPYMPGRTLRRWCAEVRRPWRAIVRAYAQVARALAAAHDVGLAHGDMKAEHAIIDDAEERVAIVDFGGDGEAAEDQLALCVALFEALADDGDTEHGDRVVDPPPVLHRVIARGLAADPSARWPSMRALARALEAGG